MTTLDYLLTLITPEQRQHIEAIAAATVTTPTVNRMTVTGHDIRAEVTFNNQHTAVTVTIYNRL